MALYTVCWLCVVYTDITVVASTACVLYNLPSSQQSHVGQCATKNGVTYSFVCTCVHILYCMYVHMHTPGTYSETSVIRHSLQSDHLMRYTHYIKDVNSHSVIRQPPNPTLFSSPIECRIREDLLYLYCLCMYKHVHSYQRDGMCSIIQCCVWSMVLHVCHVELCSVCGGAYTHIHSSVHTIS